MSSTATLLQYACGAGALYCALAYIYGFIWKPKGDRRVHVASLLFTGLALGSLAAIMPSILGETNAFAAFCATFFLIGSVGCQSYCAFRGRKTDRRTSDARAADAPIRVVDDRRKAA